MRAVSPRERRGSGVGRQVQTGSPNRGVGEGAKERALGLRESGHDWAGATVSEH